MRFRVVAGLVVAFATGVGTVACGARDRDRSEALLASAAAHREKGEYDLAIADYDSALARDSIRAATYFERGFAQQLAKRYDRALTDYDRAIALQPDWARAYNARGVTLQLTQQYDRALESYDAALKLQPEMAIAMKNRGRAHFYLGHYAEAARDLSAGLARDTTNAFVAVWLHIVRQRLGTADTTALARQIARTDRTRWPAPAAALYLGRITPVQFADSLTTGDSTARAMKRCGGAFFLGEYLLGSVRADEAKAHFEEARSICPHDETEYMGSVAELERLRVASVR